MRLAWKTQPLRTAHRDEWCPHEGAGRESYMAVVTGDDGKVLVLGRLPLIRSCCAADPVTRRTWWETVEEWIANVKRFAGSDADPGWYGELDVRLITAGLIERMPRPTPVGNIDYTVFEIKRGAEMDGSPPR